MFLQRLVLNTKVFSNPPKATFSTSAISFRVQFHLTEVLVDFDLKPRQLSTFSYISLRKISNTPFTIVHFLHFIILKLFIIFYPLFLTLGKEKVTQLGKLYSVAYIYIHWKNLEVWSHGQLERKLRLDNFEGQVHGILCFTVRSISRTGLKGLGGFIIEIIYWPLKRSRDPLTMCRAADFDYYTNLAGRQALPADSSNHRLANNFF